MMSTVLTAPELLSGRLRAQRFADPLPEDLHNDVIVIDWSLVRAAAPSFVDELIKAILVERQAAALVLRDIPDRTATYARRSADRREVADRLRIEARDVVTR